MRVGILVFLSVLAGATLLLQARICACCNSVDRDSTFVSAGRGVSISGDGGVVSASVGGDTCFPVGAGGGDSAVVGMDVPVVHKTIAFVRGDVSERDGVVSVNADRDTSVSVGVVGGDAVVMKDGVY